MERLTESNPSWIDDELWESACEPDCEEIDAVYRKLKDYEDLDEQGKLIKLPCMVGSDIYAITFDYEKEQYDITKSKIIEINQNCNGWFFRSLISIPAFKINDFGKSVFLARDEAEAKLKELRGKGNDN